MTASPTGICPVDLTASFLKMCHAQSCGKCTPCRIGLGTLEKLLESVLDGKATMQTLEAIENTAQGIYLSADCAIGYEAARMVLKGLEGFKDDYVEHIKNGRCTASMSQAVPCVAECPAEVDIPGYIGLIAEGRYQDAVKLIRKDNPFVSVCGLVCEHPCENRCRRTMMDAPINIRGLKRYAAEVAGEVPVPKPLEKTGKKVAVIGGGPGGLTTAYYLALMGHEVTIFEAKKKLGGMLRYGIPSYRLPREILDKEIQTILSAGIEVKLQTPVGVNPSIADLKKEYDAICVAIGAQSDKKLGLEGEDAKGVYSAVEMLRGIGDNQMPDFSGKNVVVVGGGNVAMDVARSSIRLGANNVKIVYRRRMQDMTAMPEEVIGAVDEGCELLELQAPVRIEKDQNGNVVALWVKPQIIGQHKWGRPAPRNSSKPEERIECDVIIVAIGQAIGTEFENDLPMKRGNIFANDACAFGEVEGVFAGGDCVSGPATVIKAIAAGKVMAANIDQYLGFNHKLKVDVEIAPADLRDKVPCGRVTMSERTAAERKDDFDLMEICMTNEEAMQESQRCLRCDNYGCGKFKGGRKQW